MKPAGYLYRHLPEASKMTMDANTKSTRNSNMKNSLYQTIDGKEFGTYLATDSAGRTVLEMKGTGEVKSFEKQEVEVVMPFTFAVRFLKNGKQYHYLGEKDNVQVGDVLVGFSQFGDHSLQMAEVTAVDTKSEMATKQFVGRKLITEPL